jgi:uncharacterized membrane protein
MANKNLLNNIHPRLRQVLVWLGNLLPASALLAVIDGRGSLLVAWGAYALLLALAAAAIYGTWKATGSDKATLAPALGAFVLRLAVGGLLLAFLPVLGYVNSAEHQAGYVFHDAYIRDHQAWGWPLHPTRSATPSLGAIPATSTAACWRSAPPCTAISAPMPSAR